MTLAAVWTFLCSRIGIALAVVTLIVVAGIYTYHRGSDAGKAVDLRTTIQTQEKINDADARGPRNSRDVDKRLRDGSF